MSLEQAAHQMIESALIVLPKHRAFRDVCDHEVGFVLVQGHAREAFTVSSGFGHHWFTAAQTGVQAALHQVFDIKSMRTTKFIGYLSRGHPA